jgi:riboflavin synthase
MFTGLIETTGRIDWQDRAPAGRRLQIETPLAAELAPGDSIAVNGVCLTVTARQPDAFSADLSPATLAATSLGSLPAGRVVNLERPLAAGARLGGHFVLGHVDGTGRVTSLRSQGESWWLEVEAPANFEPLVVPKGSIAVDGISLTVAALTGRVIGMQIVPFTYAHTALPAVSVGDPVNLEADVLGKYVVRLLGTRLEREAVSAAGERLS